MNLMSGLIIAILYGSYDFIIRLSAGKINPTLGAFLCQIFSALTILLIIVYQKLILKSFVPKITNEGVGAVAAAGFLIGMALFSLFIFFQQRGLKISTALPTILVLRNLTVVILGILVLQEKLTWTKILGLVLILSGVYLLT